MDIKLVRNFGSGTLIPVSKSVVLEINKTNEFLHNFQYINYILIDVDNNVKKLLFPEIKKYDFCEFINVCNDRDKIYFSTIKNYDAVLETVNISINRYSVINDEYEQIYSEDFDESKISNLKYRMFVLNENYVLMQVEEYEEISEERVNKKLNDIFLYDIETGNKTKIYDQRIFGGIEDMINIDANICAIKTGFSNVDVSYNSKEIIGFINIKQFISDLVLGKNEISMEICDENDENCTMPFVKAINSSILYSKTDLKALKDEVKMYDYETKVSKIRVNDHISSIEELGSNYAINDTMYFVLKNEEGTQIINLNTGRSEWDIEPEYEIKFIKNDIFVLQHNINGLFVKDKPEILLYRFPDVENPVLKEKSNCVGCLLVDDVLMLFCEK